MIIVSAAAFEVQPLHAALVQRQIAVDWITCGIGVLAAATAAAQARDACCEQEVLFIGTCGTFGDFTGVKLCRAQRLVWSPTCGRAGLSYAVDDTPPLTLAAAPCYATLPAVDVLCAPNVSLVNTQAHQYTNCVENIEAYAFLHTLAAVTTTLTVLLAVTNAVGKAARRQWRQHHAHAAQLTAEFVLQKRFAQAQEVKT